MRLEGCGGDGRLLPEFRCIRNSLSLTRNVFSLFY